jgi:hypothetical protein
MRKFSTQSLKKTFILVFVTMICSCATNHRYKAWERQDNPVFMCTKTDFKNLENPFEPVTFWWPGSYLPMWISIPVVTIGDIVTILDMPISLVVDAVCLPFDINQKNKIMQSILKKQKNATAMYAQNTGFIYPVLNTPIGYDLEKGDLVEPYGEGLISDFIFICKNQYIDRNKHYTSVSISFSNKNDGIRLYEDNIKLKHRFVWPPAPKDGYTDKLYKYRSNNWNGLTSRVHNIFDQSGSYDSQKGGYRRDKRPCYYIFRVRTKLDEQGDVISAKYGKIQGDFSVSGSAGGGQVKFTYYFNPDGTPNLEFDKKKNLFKWPKTNRKERNKADEKRNGLNL